MVCIAILLIAGSFFSYKISEVLVLTKTNKAIKTISSHIDLCERLAFHHDSDILLKLKQQEDFLVCTIGTPGGQGLYANTPPLTQKFSGLSFIFKDLEKFTETSEVIEVSFSSTGTISPNGNLTLIGPKERIKKVFSITNKYSTDAEQFPLHPKDAKAFQEKDKPIQVEQIP